MSKSAAYYVLVVGHAPNCAAVHIAPSLVPSVPIMGRFITAVGPFPTLLRALHAQQYMVEEWCCAIAPPGPDPFVVRHWGWSVEQEELR